MQKPAPAHLIQTDAELQDLARLLQTQSIIACDTESNGMYAYHEHVCLIQLSLRINGHTEDYIIDPLALDDLTPLADAFAAPTIEVVFHAAESDIGVLKRDYGFHFVTIFDTYIAARTLGWPRVGLAAILSDRFGVALDKRYQQADWSKRPLPSEQLLYAQYDTHYLIDLRDELREHLMTEGYWEEASEYFQQTTQFVLASKTFDPEGFWRLKATQDLSGRALAILRALYIWRETKAEQRDVPPFKIMHDQELAIIASIAPSSYEELMALRRVSHAVLQRYAKGLLRVIANAQRDPIPIPPRGPSRPDDNVLARYQLLHQWRKHKAVERGVESDIILPKEALWALAYRAPVSYDELADIEGLWPYRREKYASEILSILATVEE